ncbi:MAG: hypothetical protein R3C10_08550 [Pirellulales bacterium]
MRLRAAPFALAAGICLALSPAASAQTGPTVITFPWDWHISVAPNIGSPTAPEPSDVPVDIWLWGTATIAFDAPINVGDPNAPPTFDLGPGGIGPDTPTAEPPPEGGIYTIPIEIVAMDLHSMGPAVFPGGTSDVIIRESQSRPSTGVLNNVRNLGDGTIAMDSFFDVFFEIELPQLDMRLQTEEPTQLGMSFGPPGSTPPGDNMLMDPLPELDILWGPTWFWRTFPPGQAPPWVDASFHPWDWPVTLHGHVTVPEPGSIGLAMLSVLTLALAHMRRR